MLSSHPSPGKGPLPIDSPYFQVDIAHLITFTRLLFDHHGLLRGRISHGPNLLSCLSAGTQYCLNLMSSGIIGSGPFYGARKGMTAAHKLG